MKNFLFSKNEEKNHLFSFKQHLSNSFGFKAKDVLTKSGNFLNEFTDLQAVAFEDDLNSLKIQSSQFLISGSGSELVKKELQELVALARAQMNIMIFH